MNDQHSASIMGSRINGRSIAHCNPIDLAHEIDDQISLTKLRTGLWDIVFSDKSEIQFASFGAIYTVVGVYASILRQCDSCGKMKENVQNYIYSGMDTSQCDDCINEASRYYSRN